MKTKQSRIFLILTIAILIVNIFLSNRVFGAIYDLSDYKNVVGSTRWCIVYSAEKNNIYLIKTDCTYLGYEGTWSGSNSNTRFYKSMGGITVYIFNVSDNKFYHLTSCDYQQWSCGTDIEFIACNKDVIRPISDSTTKTVFQKTPVPGKTLINPNLTETIMEALETLIQTIINKITTIIPVGLVVLSIGLLIYVVKLVISRAT